MGAPLVPFWSLRVPLGVPFGAIMAPWGALGWPFGAILVPGVRAFGVILALDGAGGGL